jgi:hypothetical protein
MGRIGIVFEHLRDYWPPTFSIASAAEWIVPSSLGCGVSWPRSRYWRRRERRAAAIASPMPREAPVMKRVVFERH